MPTKQIYVQGNIRARKSEKKYRFIVVDRDFSLPKITLLAWKPRIIQIKPDDDEKVGALSPSGNQGRKKIS